MSKPDDDATYFVFRDFFSEIVVGVGTDLRVLPSAARFFLADRLPSKISLPRWLCGNGQSLCGAAGLLRF